MGRQQPPLQPGLSKLPSQIKKQSLLGPVSGAGQPAQRQSTPTVWVLGPAAQGSTDLGGSGWLRGSPIHPTAVGYQLSDGPGTPWQLRVFDVLAFPWRPRTGGHAKRDCGSRRGPHFRCSKSLHTPTPPAPANDLLGPAYEGLCKGAIDFDLS